MKKGRPEEQPLQIGWYGFQIAVFGGIVLMFMKEDAPQVGALPILFIALGITAIATGLVFWTGRLIAWIVRTALGKPNEASHRRIDGARIIDGGQPRKLSAGGRISKEPR